MTDVLTDEDKAGFLEVLVLFVNLSIILNVIPGIDGKVAFRKPGGFRCLKLEKTYQ